jgi:hypothetical protein
MSLYKLLHRIRQTLQEKARFRHLHAAQRAAIEKLPPAPILTFAPSDGAV